MDERSTFSGWVVIRALLAMVYLWAGIGKIAGPFQFYLALRAYQLPVPGGVLSAVAATLPWLELVGGLMLLVRFHVETALAWAWVLFAMFTLVTGQAWLRGLDIACGCLNLGVFGNHLGQRALAILEAPAFAFFRALFLWWITMELWKRQTLEDASLLVPAESFGVNNIACTLESPNFHP